MKLRSILDLLIKVIQFVAKRKRIDKSLFDPSIPTRHRSPKHLMLVREQPCCVCKTNYDIHAHHITYAQSNGMGLKVCDSYTVPLCMFHHMELHQQYGNERKFWLNYCLEPIIYSQLLWKITCK